MKTDQLSRKSRGILDAIARGHSCEQILAADHSLTYHDIFHAAAQSPASRRRPPVRGANDEWPAPAKSGQKPAPARID